jgi:hypothetical protein
VTTQPPSELAAHSVDVALIDEFVPNPLDIARLAEELTVTTPGLGQ